MDGRSRIAGASWGGGRRLLAPRRSRVSFAAASRTLPTKELNLIQPRLLALAFVLPLILACQSAYAATGGASPKAPPAGLLPPAKGPIELRVENGVGPKLSGALQQLSAVTGVTFTADEIVQRELDSIACGVLTSVSVPAPQAWLWVESLLQHGGFVLSILSAEAPHLVAVHTQVPRGGRPPYPIHDHFVPASRIEALSEHPALMVSTTLELPHTDVRQLGNSLRGLTTDPTGRQNVIPVGNTNSVILSGTGQGVLQLVTILREVEAAEAAAAARRAQEAKPAEEPASTPPR